MCFKYNKNLQNSCLRTGCLRIGFRIKRRGKLWKKNYKKILQCSRSICPELDASWMLDKCTFPVFFKSCFQFFLRVHDNWPIPGYRFSNGFSRYQKEPYASISCSHLDRIPIPIENQGFLTYNTVLCRVKISFSFNPKGARSFSLSKFPLPSITYAKTVYPGTVI